MENNNNNTLSFSAIPALVIGILNGLSRSDSDKYGISAVLMQFIVAVRHECLNGSRFKQRTSRSNFLFIINKHDLALPHAHMTCTFSRKEHLRVDSSKNARVPSIPKHDSSKFMRIVLEISDAEEVHNPT